MLSLVCVPAISHNRRIYAVFAASNILYISIELFTFSEFYLLNPSSVQCLIFFSFLLYSLKFSATRTLYMWFGPATTTMYLKHRLKLIYSYLQFMCLIPYINIMYISLGEYVLWRKHYVYFAFMHCMYTHITAIHARLTRIPRMTMFSFMMSFSFRLNLLT